MQRKNPYDALRAIHAVATRMGTSPEADRIMDTALGVLHEPATQPPYATQDDVLDAIRGRCKQVPFGSPAAHLAMAIQDLAELGLVLPAIELTPAQRVAGQLFEASLKYEGLLRASLASLQERGYETEEDSELTELHALLEPLRPVPPAPTLEEALQAVRDLTHELRCADKGLVGTERAQVIARAQALTARVPK